MYQVEVQVQTLRVPDWISRYCQPERFVPLCSACPQYGKNWACPPGMPQVERIACPGGRVSRFHDDHGRRLRAVSAVCQGRRKVLQASKGDAIFLFRSRI